MPAAGLNFAIQEEDLTAPGVLALLDQHLSEMRDHSPAENVHAMPAERLAEKDVTFYSLRAGEKLAAVGAIKHLDEQTGELKSMRAADAFRGQGIGAAMLKHLLSIAKTRGYKALGLETGTAELFAPAHKLYTKYGFCDCERFGPYQSDDFTRCMVLTLNSN